MFIVTKKSANRLDLELNGKLEKEEMKKAWDDFQAALEGLENGRVLYKIHNFKVPSAGSFMVEFSHMPEFPEIIRKIDRVALVTNEEWMQKAVSMGDKILGVELEGFKLDELAEAEAFLEKP